VEKVKLTKLPMACLIASATHQDKEWSKGDSSCKKPLSICNSTFMALVIRNYFKTVLIWKIFNPNYDFLVPLCLYLVQKYEKNAVANDKWFFAT
jgi:hypothetical protein